MTEPSSTMLVLGIGNILLGDEGVGIHVVRRLERMKLPKQIRCLDGGTGGFYLLEAMQQAERIVIIDAAASSDAVGTIRVLSPRYSRDYPDSLSAHDVGLKDLLNSFYLLGTPANIRLIAITINPDQELSTELSPVIARSADRAVELALKEIDEYAGVSLLESQWEAQRGTL